MRKRVKKILITGILFVVLMMTGCKEQEEQPVEITLMHGWGGTLQTCKIMTEIYDEFSNENPDIILKCIPYSDSSVAVEKANDMLAVGKIPDIIGTNGLSYYVKNAAKLDKAMNLLPHIEADQEWKESISSSVFDTWVTGNNKLYTIPDAIEAAGYWYNEEYLREAGWADESGQPKEPRTWKEFIEMTKQLQKWIDETGKEISVFSLEEAQMVENLFLARLAGEGRNGLAAAKNSYKKVERETLENVIKDLKVISDCSIWVDNIENARQRFWEGKSIIYFNGVWESDILKESDLKDCFDYAPYPTKDGKSLAYVSASSGYVLAKQNDKRKEEAQLRFLKYMLSDEVQTKIAIETGQAPVNPHIDVNQITEEYPMFGNAIQKVYGVDIKLETLFSVWTEKDVSVVQKYLNKSVPELDEIDYMLRELNGD